MNVSINLSNSLIPPLVSGHNQKFIFSLFKTPIMKKMLLMLIVVLFVFSFNAHALPIASPPETFVDGWVKWWHSIFG